MNLRAIDRETLHKLLHEGLLIEAEINTVLMIVVIKELFFTVCQNVKIQNPFQ